MSRPTHPIPAKADPDEPPPIAGTWRRLYAIVIANTVIVYLILYLFSRYAAR